MEFDTVLEQEIEKAVTREISQKTQQNEHN